MTKKPTREFIVPEWANVFDEDPLELNEKTDIEAFVASLERRLDALLQLHGCSPTPDGWRTLALKLALGFTLNGKNLKNKNPLKIITPKTRERKGSGRPKGPMSEFWIKEINWQISHAQPGDNQITITEAASRVRRKYDIMNRILKRNDEDQYSIPNVDRLENIYSEAKNKRHKIVPWQMIINLSLQKAAVRLEEKSRK
jgi:hypothetical protein